MSLYITCLLRIHMKTRSSGSKELKVLLKICGSNQTLAKWEKSHIPMMVTHHHLLLLSPVTLVNDL